MCQPPAWSVPPSYIFTLYRFLRSIPFAHAQHGIYSQEEFYDLTTGPVRVLTIKQFVDIWGNYSWQEVAAYRYPLPSLALIRICTLVLIHTESLHLISDVGRASGAWGMPAGPMDPNRATTDNPAYPFWGTHVHVVCAGCTKTVNSSRFLIEASCKRPRSPH